MVTAFAPDQATAILAAMQDVAMCGGEFSLSEIDRHSLKGAAKFVLRVEVPSPVPDVTPEELAAILPDQDQRVLAVRFLAVMSVVDGRIEPARVQRAKTFADALGIEGEGIELLTQSAQGHLHEALACMMRQNILSISGREWLTDDFLAFFLPYKGTPEDQALEARFEALRDLPEGTLGREYWQWYKTNGFAFPGNPSGLCVDFAIPHDSTHLLSGYDTSPHGELLVSTFTAGMHPHEPMEGHILPVIYSWHLGIRINDVATSSLGQFDADHFWEAWERGCETQVDLFARGWDFWSVAGEDLQVLRDRYGVPPRESADPLGP